MTSSNTNTLLRLSSSYDSVDRLKAVEALIVEIATCPIEDLDTIFQNVDEILGFEISTTSRVVCFDLLTRALCRRDLSRENRSKSLRILTRSFGAGQLAIQLDAISVALEAESGFWPETGHVVLYLINQIVSQSQAKRAIRDRLRSEGKHTTKETSPEERGFEKLLNIVVNAVKRYPGEFSGSVATQLFDQALQVAEKALDTATVERICLLIRACLDKIALPEKTMQRCVEDLCAIYSATQRLQSLTWDCFALLARDPQNEKNLTRIVLRAICNPPQERANFTVSGAIMMTRCIILQRENIQIQLPSFETLMGKLHLTDFTSRSVCKECLRLLLTILKTDSLISQALQEDDWQPLFQLLQRCIGIESPSNHADGSSIDSPGGRVYDPDNSVAELLKCTADALIAIWPRCRLHHQLQMSCFLNDFRGILPAGYIARFINEVIAKCHMNTGPAKDEFSVEQLVDYFFVKAGHDFDAKCAVIKVLKSFLAESSLCEGARTTMQPYILKMFQEFPRYKNVPVANSLGDLLVCIPDASAEDFQLTGSVLSLIWPLVNTAEDSSVLEMGGSCSGATAEPRNTVALSIVELFIKSSQHAPREAAKIYDLLIMILRTQQLPSSSRLYALRLLTSLRCDGAGRIIMVGTPDLSNLPAVVARYPTVSLISQPRSSLTHDSEKGESLYTRTNGFNGKSLPTPRLTVRSSVRSERQVTEAVPSWLCDGHQIPKLDKETPIVTKLHLHNLNSSRLPTIHIGDWLVEVISIIQSHATVWDVYSFVLVHLPAQLRNRQLFNASMPHIGMLRRIILDQLLESNVFEPPHDSNTRKGDIALCLFHALATLIGYSDNVERREQERIVHAFQHGIAQWERTAQFCIQSLSVCCHVLPTAMVPRLSAILQKMSQVVTQSHLTVDILEFLAGLARLRPLYVNFREEEFRTVFAICVRYLEYSREQRTRLLTKADIASVPKSPSLKSDDQNSEPDKPDLYQDLPQYVFALAYQVITAWFLSVKISNRNDHVGWITKNLSWVDEAGNEIMEEQSQVTLDMMLRTSYLNLGETVAEDPFTTEDGPVLTKTWLLVLSIVTIETAAYTGLSRITKRQASGTTYAVYKQQTRELPLHHEPTSEDGQGSGFGIAIFPNHILLQLASSIAPVPSPMEAICLPEDEQVRRALSVFDRNDTVDGYKVGVIFLGSGQTTESAILANTHGSTSFEEFLEGLGTKVALQGATFNTQGLDKTADSDGSHTFAWRDRITEIIFHIPTMMPTDMENDPQCINKKRHIGNDYVNIIWNESGLPFQFDTFQSQFNCVNIVITPEASRARQQDCPGSISASDPCFYTMKTTTAATFPDLSPAVVSRLLPAKSLAPIARQLALQASVFSNVWVNRDTGEHASSWRNRLRAIKQMRERYANTGISTSARFPGARSSKSYSQGDTFKARVTMGGLAEQGESLAASLDFSRWAGPNAPLTRL